MSNASITTHHARILRQNATDAEKLLWQHLRGRRLGSLKFRRQSPIGPYIVDFYCVSAKLILELDGHDNDPQRLSFFDQRRLTLLRIDEEDVTRDPKAVCRRILAQAGRD